MFSSKLSNVLMFILMPAAGFAGISVTATEQDGYVEFAYSGSFDLGAAAGHTQTFNIQPADFVSPTTGSLLSISGDIRVFEVTSAMGAFGSSPGSFPVSSLSGDGFGWSNVWVYFPLSWSDGDTIIGSITASGSYDSLGLVAGNYLLSAWGGDVSLTVSESGPPVVPEPSTYTLILGVAVMGFAARRVKARCN